MAKNGPIIIIDDDPEDQNFCVEALNSVGIHNKTQLFENGVQALNYLITTKESPFLIICDIKMPKMDGIELRNKICETPHLIQKAIPFVFMTGHADKDEIAKAYALSVQGFFEKQADIEDLKDILRLITNYWRHCKHPNSN